MPPGASPAQDLAPPTPPFRILVFGDRPAVMNALRHCFDARGHETALVFLSDLRHAYEDCVRLVLDSRPLVVLFDLRTADASGWDFLQALRETGSLLPFPFVTTTADVAALDRATREDTGALELADEHADLTAVSRAVEVAARSAAL